MQASKQRIQQHLKHFTIRQLFVEELMWNIVKDKPFSIVVDTHSYILRPLVEKSGVNVYLCDLNTQGRIPTDSILRKIERELTRNAFEHIIVYADETQESQVWQWVKREKGKAPRTRYSRLHKEQTGELLSQKLLDLFFTIEDEPGTTEVSGRIEKAFDTEPVSRKFYDRFQKELKVFTNFIYGITAQGDKEWYASLMLNRLMFIYFIQRQGFLNYTSETELNGEKDYLRIRLNRVREQYGEDEFHTFYRYFLLSLFSDLSTLEGQRIHEPELDALLGEIPYLNGGLFDVHKLEQENLTIHIPDDAFEKIFDFFDAFEWHLDDRPLSKNNEINPDVLGYIFEKYINQKQMGAYYTKEDITEYIGKNTILPYLFEAVKEDYALAFVPDGPVWSLLRDNPDEYIYEAVAKGTHLSLPPEIEVGLHNISKRIEWNKPAPQDFALPTEIWREVVARRQHYESLHSKLVNGEITSISDLITYNLDIRKFTQDVLTYCGDIHLLNAFYKHIRKVTVLDPTCGSGAFLFAALNILGPLYAACLTRMQTQVDKHVQLPVYQRCDLDIIATFQGILREVAIHHNRDYFILKSIIINNLHGVDIMEEATEICKLRLFLKLASQVKSPKGIEPLPDIDFNIRAGNTLIGFTTLDDVRTTVNKNLESMLFSTEMLARIEQQAQHIERNFQSFRKLQTELQPEYRAVATAKQALRNELDSLNTELDTCLASKYKIDENNKQDFAYQHKFKQWQESHKPFHWYSQFYGAMHDGGFDVIIGNPPYVEYSKVKKDYTLVDYHTLDSGNIYATMLERSFFLSNPKGYSSFIVPISAACTDRTTSLQTLLQKMPIRWYSAFDVFPSRIFEGAAQRLLILIVANKSNAMLEFTKSTVFTSKYYRWYQDERPALMSLVKYAEASEFDKIGWLPRIEGNITLSILKKIKDKELVNFMNDSAVIPLYVHRIINNFIKAIDFTPYFRKASGEVTVSDDFKKVYILKNYRLVAMSVLNSSLFYWYWRCHGDGFHCGYRDIGKFPLNFASFSMEDNQNLELLAKKLGDDLNKHSEIRVRNQVKTGKVELQTFFVGLSKPIIDEIDRVLAKHYGFTDEELDFIINYDIKYRMGKQHATSDENEEGVE